MDVDQERRRLGVRGKEIVAVPLARPIGDVELCRLFAAIVARGSQPTRVDVDVFGYPGPVVVLGLIVEIAHITFQICSGEARPKSRRQRPIRHDRPRKSYQDCRHSPPRPVSTLPLPGRSRRSGPRPWAARWHWMSPYMWRAP